jgi:hypothetical protein
MQFHYLLIKLTNIQLINFKIISHTQIPSRVNLFVLLRNQCVNVKVNLFHKYHYNFILIISNQQVQIIKKFVKLYINLKY